MESSEMVKLGQLVVSLGALVWIVCLFLKGYRQRKKVSDADRNEHEISVPSWVHAIYIGAIAAFIVLEFIVYVVLNNDKHENVIDSISFGATLSSLIMSVVAIIFTIVSGKNGQEQLGKISEATEDLRTTAQSLQEFKTTATDIKQRVEELFNNVDNHINDLDRKIDTKISGLDIKITQYHDSQTSMMQQLSGSGGDKDKAESIDDEIDEAFKKKASKIFATRASFISSVLMCACSYAKEKDKPIKVSDMGYIFSNFSEYIGALLVAFQAFLVVEYEGEIPDVKIVEVCPGIRETAEKTVKEYIENTMNDSFRKRTISEFNEMRAYFGLEAMQFNEDKAGE